MKFAKLNHIPSHLKQQFDTKPKKIEIKSKSASLNLRNTSIKIKLHTSLWVKSKQKIKHTDFYVVNTTKKQNYEM